MKKFFFLTLMFLLIPSFCFPNRVFIILGSDTSIWWNMSGGRTKQTYHNYFDFDVFSNPQGVFRDVFDEDFRNSITDSTGRPFRFTWYMHGGGWFTEGTNTLPASTTFLIRKYWEDELERWGDEIAYHFHHFDWNGSSWVMADTFVETIWDFEETMSQMIIDESVYPVSFRSGWNYMNNNYQNYLEKWMPFRMEGTRGDWTPYHPSYDNYRVHGDMKGWEVQHYHMNGISKDLANRIFKAAGQGAPQVVCIWSHQNEGSFITQIANVDIKIKDAASHYPSVRYYYGAGKECMDLYMACTGQGSVPSAASSTPEAIVVDNDDGVPSYVEEGTWTTSGSTGYNGGTYRFAWGGDPSFATWYVTLPQKGYYDVYNAFLQSDNRVDAARYIVHGADGDYAVDISQNGPMELVERPLGTFHLDTAASVTLDASKSLPSSGAVISDALLFRWSDSQEPTPTPSPTPPPTPTPTPYPTATFEPPPPPRLDLVTDVDDQQVDVTIHSDPDIYPLQPWVAARTYNDRYLRLDTSETSPSCWNFSYSTGEIDRVVVGVCDIYGSVSLKDVKDGSHRISTQSEFRYSSAWNLDLLTSPVQASLKKAVADYPIVVQDLSENSTDPLLRSYWIGQTFIPKAAGVSRVDFGVTVSEPSQYRVELRETMPDGFPDDNPSGLLASSVVEVESSGMASAPLDYEGLVLDGRRYGLVFKIISGSGEIRLHTENPYPDGLLIRAYSLDWITISNFDCQFQVYDASEALSIDQSSFNSDAYTLERGFFAAQTFSFPGRSPAGLEIDVTEAAVEEMIQIQLRKTLPGGFPDFSRYGLLEIDGCMISTPGKKYVPLKWNIPREYWNSKLALVFVSPEEGINSVQLGYAEGDPYPGGAMYVSHDLATVERLDDQDLYFRLYSSSYVTSGGLTMEYDAGKSVVWTGAELTRTVSKGNSIKTRYRFADTKEELTLAPWTEYYDTREVKFSPTPRGRFIQADVLLEYEEGSGPALKSLEVFYQPSRQQPVSGFLLF